MVANELNPPPIHSQPAGADLLLAEKVPRLPANRHLVLASDL